MINSLNAYLNITQKQKVGTLAQKNRKIYFEYDKEFLKTGLELSPYKLPLKSGIFRCDDDVFDGIWGLFGDSLPDGWGRLLVDRHLIKLGINPNSLTPLDRLVYVGDNAMGALSYEPEHLIDSKIEDIVLDDLARNSKEILEGSSEELLEELLSLNGSSAGARPKILVQMSDDLSQIVHNQTVLKKGFSHWIVKFASKTDSNEIGAIEYAYSLMAKEAGIDIPKTALIDGKNGRYFAVKRFDRVGQKRIHVHSVAGLIHSDFRFPVLDYDDLLHLTLHLTKDIKEVEKLFRLASFNLFCHNRDDHVKNFSFIMDENGKWQLSPAYDITFSYGPGGEHSMMYLGVGKNPTTKHLLKLAKKHSIKNAPLIIDEVTSVINRWKDFAKSVGVSLSNTKNIEKILNQI